MITEKSEGGGGKILRHTPVTLKSRKDNWLNLQEGGGGSDVYAAMDSTHGVRCRRQRGSDHRYAQSNLSKYWKVNFAAD